MQDEDSPLSNYVPFIELMEFDMVEALKSLVKKLLLRFRGPGSTWKWEGVGSLSTN